MPSRLTRRQLLGGLAAGGAATYTGYRFLPAKVVPAPILEQRTKWRSVPTVDTSLPVAPDAVESSRDHLREVVDRAEAAWDEVDDSDVDGEREEFDRSLENSVEVGRERLAETEGADPTTETLKTLRFGVNRAAWSLAAAKAITEDYDHGGIRERSNALSDDVNDFANAIVYEVADPRRGLASLYLAERAIHFARMNADNAPAAASDEQEYDHRAVVQAIRSEIEGRRWLGDATAIYDVHRSNVADVGPSADLEAHLGRTWRDFAGQIDGRLPDREAAIEQYLTAGEGPRERAATELFNNGYSAADDAHPPSFGPREGLVAFVAVEHAKALQHARGFTSAMEQLDSAFADGEVGMALAARTKRRASQRLHDLLADSDDPITRELAARPREEISIGDWPLGANSTFESEYPYAEAYAMYLLAAENVRHTPEVRDALLP
jgi:hypothetical protein